MKSHRTISLTLTLLAVLVGAWPASAPANSLLSGYGGPGEGSQAILGSALVGGGGGGGSSNGSSASSESSTSEVTGAGARVGGGGIASRSPNGQGSRARSTGRRPADGRAGSRSGNGEASGGAVRAYPALSRDASQATSGGSGGWGVSGEDLVYVFLTLGALVLTGVATRRLARAPARSEGL